MKLCLLGLFALQCFVFTLGVQASADDLPDVISKVKQSVVVIEAFARAGGKVGTGSGFSVGKGLIVTNIHVLEGGHRFLVGRSDGGKAIVRGIRAFDRQHDMALLEISNADGKADIPPLQLADDNDVREGSAIFVLGHPQELKFTVTSGIISSTERMLSHLSPDLPKTHVLQSDAATSPGSSGGPWVNSSGRVVGVHRAGMSAFGVQGFNFATHVKYLRPLLNRERETLLPPDFFQVSTWMSLRCVRLSR